MALLFSFVEENLNVPIQSIDPYLARLLSVVSRNELHTESNQQLLESI